MSSHILLRRKPASQFLQTLLILVAGLWAFSPAFFGEWLWDDNVYIIANPLMIDPEGLWKIWFQPGILIDYYPITFSAQRIEWNLWGMNPLGYHLTTIALHLSSALLVWRLFSKLGLRLAWWGGLLFAIHPVMVESVAWISEMKNTLSLPPLLWAMCLWVDYDEHKRNRDYVLALTFFFIALLCKNSVVMLPTVILLYAWWKRGRIESRDLQASTPFFALSLLFGFLGAWLEHHHPGPIAYVTADWLSRVDTAERQIFFFLFLCLFPLHLLPIYPDGLVVEPAAADFLPCLLLIGLFYVSWINRKTWGRHMLLGLGFFLLNLFPILGFILGSVTTMIWSMDHLVYLPIIGLIGLVIAGLGWVDRTLSNPLRTCLIGIAASLTALLALECHTYAGIFSDAETLWLYAYQGNPNSWMVRTNLGETLWQRGQIPEAIEQFKAAVKINPSYDTAHYDLAKILTQTHRIPEAIREYEAVLRVNPSYANAYYDLGSLLLLENRIPEATDQFEQAVQIDPRHAAAHYALGNLLLNSNQIPEAINQYELSLQINPDHFEVHSALGKALLKINQLPEALDQCMQATQLNRNDVEAQCNLGVALARMGRFTEAGEQFKTVLKTDPNYVEAHNNLGSVYLVTGKFAQAIEQYQAALLLKPDLMAAQKNLARAEAMEKTHGMASPSLSP